MVQGCVVAEVRFQVAGHEGWITVPDADAYPEKCLQRFL